MLGVAESLCLGKPTFLKGHKLPVTCVALPGGAPCEESTNASRGVHAYTGSKDCCIIRWELETGAKEIFKGQRNCFVTKGYGGTSAHCGGHFRAVLDVCVAADEKMFFSAGADHTVRAWDPRASNERYMSLEGPCTPTRPSLGMEAVGVRATVNRV